MNSVSSCRVAVIGAGAAGLTAIKELLEIGADVVGYDKGDRPGGLWVRGSSSGISPAYDSLHLNTSKGRTEFADFPMPEDWPDYPSVDHIARLPRRLRARRSASCRHLRFSTTVTSVERDDADGSWVVESEPGATERFDAVVVANGHNWSPRWPTPPYPGDFDGLQMHAHDYTDAGGLPGQAGPDRGHGQLGDGHRGRRFVRLSRPGAAVGPPRRPHRAQVPLRPPGGCDRRRDRRSCRGGFASASPRRCCGSASASPRATACPLPPSACSRTTRRSATRSCTASPTARSRLGPASSSSTATRSASPTAAATRST